jgi:hypothetical protein
MGHKQQGSKRSMKDMKAAVEEAGTQLVSTPAALPALFELGSITVEEIPDLAAIAQSKAEVRAWLQRGNGKGLTTPQLVEELGKKVALGLGYGREEYERYEEKVVANINTAYQIIFSPGITPGVRDELRDVFAQAVLTKMARTNEALARFTQFGSRNIGLLVPTKENDKQGIILPIAPEGGGRWQWQPFRVAKGHRNEYGLTALIRAIAHDAQEASRKVRKERVADLRTGITGHFPEVLERGKGIASFYAPNRKTGDRVYFGGDVKVEVVTIGNATIVRPLDAVGGCAGKVKRMVEMQVSIPAASIRYDRIDMSQYHGDQEAYGLTIGFHGLCRAGYLHELELKAGRDEMTALRTKQTVEPAAWLLREAAGTTFLFLKKREDGPAWSFNKKDYNRVFFLATRREDGTIAVTGYLKENHELFAGCQEFTAPGEKFNGLPSPAREILRKLVAVFNALERREAAPPRQARPNTADIEHHFLQSAGEAATSSTETGPSAT